MKLSTLAIAYRSPEAPRRVAPRPHHRRRRGTCSLRRWSTWRSRTADHVPWLSNVRHRHRSPPPFLGVARRSQDADLDPQKRCEIRYLVVAFTTWLGSQHSRCQVSGPCDASRRRMSWRCAQTRSRSPVQIVGGILRTLCREVTLRETAAHKLHGARQAVVRCHLRPQRTRTRIPTR